MSAGCVVVSIANDETALDAVSAGSRDPSLLSPPLSLVSVTPSCSDDRQASPAASAWWRSSLSGRDSDTQPSLSMSSCSEVHYRGATAAARGAGAKATQSTRQERGYAARHARRPLRLPARHLPLIRKVPLQPPVSSQ